MYITYAVGSVYYLCVIYIEYKALRVFTVRLNEAESVSVLRWMPKNGMLQS